MSFSFCIDVFSKNDYKRKYVAHKCEHVLLAKLKEEFQENFDGELQSWTKYLAQSKEIQQNWTILQKFFI